MRDPLILQNVSETQWTDFQAGVGGPCSHPEVVERWARARDLGAAAEGFRADDTVMGDTRLRERFFGRFELTSSRNYQEVWRMDAALGKAHTGEGVESLQSVASRVQALVQEIKEEGTFDTVVLVAHGDVLQITQAHYTPGIDLEHHRQLPHWPQAEIRLLEGEVP